MEEIIFTCKTITPLVMSGAEGKTPELRPPGIKASLRYWWRALHGYLSLGDLRKLEGEIFGRNNQRSNLIIKVSNENKMNTEKTPLLPHKDKLFKADAFSEKQEFEIRLCFTEKTIGDENNQIQLNRDYVKNLFILSCTLGGWGKRSRRGFGSIEITEIDGQNFDMTATLSDIFTHIETIVPGKFENSNNSIKAKTLRKERKEEYPRLLKLQVGSQQKSLTDIGQATHVIKGRNPKEYSNSIGNGSPRFASSIYISMLPNGHPIISTLKKQSKVDNSLQNELKDMILQ